MSDTTRPRHPGFEAIHDETAADAIAKLTFNRPAMLRASRRKP